MPAMSISVVSAQNLREALHITRGLVAMHPVKRDRIHQYEAVQAWPLIAPLYNGMEQALKQLLLAPSGTRFTLPELKNDYGHNLRKLYAALDMDDRDHIELHFREHWSLHDYDTHGANIATAEQFIAHINGPSQDGLFSWRYFLIDETMTVPSTSLWTMAEIWDALCCCIRKEMLGKQDCFRLSLRLDFKLNRLVPVPEPYEGFTDDLNCWVVHESNEPLAAWIDLLVKVSGDALHEVEAPDRLRPELAKMADRALEQMAGNSADPDEAMLLYRIQDELNLAWDPADGTFG